MAGIGQPGSAIPLGLFPDEDAEALAILEAVLGPQGNPRAQALRANGGGAAPQARPVPMSQPTVTSQPSAMPRGVAPGADPGRSPGGAASPTNPYDALLEQMFPQEAPEVARERSARLRGQRALGLLGALSGNEDVTNVGRHLISEGGDEEQRARQQGEARRDAQLKFSLAQLGEQQAGAREGRAFERQKELQRMQDEAALARELARSEGGLTLKSLPADTQRQYFAADRMIQTVPALITALSTADPSMFGPQAVGIGRTAAQFASPETVERMQAAKNDELARRNPEGYRLRTQILTQAAQIIHDLAGASQSQQEAQRILAFAPSEYDTIETIREKLQAAADTAKMTKAQVDNLVGGRKGAAAPSAAPTAPRIVDQPPAGATVIDASQVGR